MLAHILFLNLYDQLLYSQNFVQNLFQTFISEIFFQCFLQNLSFLFSNCLQTLSYNFLFLYDFLYISLLFEHICTSKFAMIFYISYI
jgi:hypothetical protein